MIGKPGHHLKQEDNTRSDMGEFYRQLRRQDVISVWGPDGDDKSNLVDILHKGLINGWFKEFEGFSDADKADHVGMLRKGIRNRVRKFDVTNVGFKRQSWVDVEFERHSWVDVPHLFNLKVFARRLFLNFHSDDIRASEIRKDDIMGETELIEWCRGSIFEKEDCLVVINGVQSTNDWDSIESNFLLSTPPREKAGCSILVITNEETVATHCVKGQKYQAFSIEDLKADTSFCSLIDKGTWYYGIRGMKGRLFYDRRKDALEWTKKFKNAGGNSNPDEGKDEEQFGVFAVGKYTRRSRFIYPLRLLINTGILRHAYYGAYQQIERRSWVDVPHPFDLLDFSWRLLLDFYSDDPQDKEDKVVGLMEGTVDPIQECLGFLRKEKCLVVINGLRSVEDWELINRYFFSKNGQSIIIVNSLDIKLNNHLLPWGSEQSFPSDAYYKEYDRIFYTERCQKALKWMTDEFEPVGREVDIYITEFVLSDPGLFSVWGIPGVGKSTLVRNFYYKRMLRLLETKELLLSASFGGCPFKAFGWVDIPIPFNLTEFAWRLLLDFYSDDPQAKQTATVSMMEQGRDPILECCKILHEITCLVVIDGLRSTQDWDLIRATFSLSELRNSSTVVVITNEEKVATACVGNDKDSVNITRLEADAARNLMEKILVSGGEELTSEEKKLLEDIVPKCGGLPKVIAAIAGGPSEVYRGPSRRWLLEDLNGDFMGTLETGPEFHGLRDLFSWMKSYFDAFSDSLKPCIFYLSIFSAEKNIRLQRLLWRWIAEGYCRDTSDGKTREENGRKYISELIDLSMIQKPASGAICQINGFFHEYIISRPMEDNLVFALDEGSSLNSTRAGQHLTVRSSWYRGDRIVFESIDFSRLRSLTVSGDWEPFFICSEKVNMRLLRVLDLEDVRHDVITNEDLEQIGKRLPRVKFLSLRGHTKITCLPSSMGALRQLQTLDIRNTSIGTLPLFITKLQKLRHIRAGTSEVWDWEASSVVIVPAAGGGDKDRASAAAQEGEGDVVVPADGGEEDSRASSSAQAAVTNLPAAAMGGGGSNSNSMAPAPVLAPDAAAGSPSLVPCNNGARPPTNDGGVKVPADIKKLAVLHTLGVVNVSSTSCGNCKDIIETLKQLTQLHKLGVSGINKGNIDKFCAAISGHAHLKSLSVEVGKDDDLDGLDVNNLLVWIEKIDKLEKLKLDLTIEKPEEFPDPQNSYKNFVIHLRISPIQDGDLHIGSYWVDAEVIEIQCSSKLHIKFERNGMAFYHQAKVLKFNFSRGSSLQISGLSKLVNLKEVWLKGYSNAHEQYMLQQIAEIKEDGGFKRPVLKLVETRSS